MNIRAILTIWVVLFFALTGVYAQNGNLFYKRMEGNIGDRIKITTHLIRVYDDVSGNYFYTFEGEDGKLQYGKTIELSGKIADDTALYLKEVGKTDFSFEGRLEDDRFSGTWHDPAEDTTMPFDMSTYFPNGAVAFDVHYLKSEHLLAKNDEEAPEANVELILLWPENNYFMPEVVDSVEKYITNAFYGENFKISQPDTMLVRYEREYYDQFEKQAGELYKKYHRVFNWEKMITMSVVFNSNYLVTLEYLRYAYSGGSHGMTNTSYDVINLRDGSLIGYRDVFKDVAGDSLTSLITNQIKKEYNIAKGVSLKKAGFFTDSVAPNRNIYVNGNGVGFVYNSYEIAPFSQGTISVFLPFNKIKGLIKKGTPVYQLAQGE